MNVYNVHINICCITKQLIYWQSESLAVIFQNGDGYVDSEFKMDRIIKGIEEALSSWILVNNPFTGQMELLGLNGQVHKGIVIRKYMYI